MALESANMIGGRGVVVELLFETLVVRIPLAAKLLFGTILFEFDDELSCLGVTHVW